MTTKDYFEYIILHLYFFCESIKTKNETDTKQRLTHVLNPSPFRCLNSFNNTYLLIYCHMPPCSPTRKNQKSINIKFKYASFLYPMIPIRTLFFPNSNSFIINQIIVQIGQTMIPMIEAYILYIIYIYIHTYIYIYIYYFCII